MTDQSNKGQVIFRVVSVLQVTCLLLAIVVAFMKLIVQEQGEYAGIGTSLSSLSPTVDS